ncbi:hypothetical protein ACFWQL_00775 [Amycolatopsis thermoflava]|uniref:hypothetical protein n=1 Tax=Amycolatopsis thermoflava TaxID=84480 RepID=UPI00364A93CC
MSRNPPGHSWSGFTEAQAKLLDLLDHLGNNGWARNPQTEELMPKVLSDLHEVGLSLERIRNAMASLGYDNDALHQLDRWESKRTTGRFGR